MTTTAQMRHDINEVASGNEPGGEPVYRDKNPFRKFDLLRILEFLTDESADHDMEKSRVRYQILQEIGEDPDPFDATTPLKKHQIRKLHGIIVEE